MTRIKKTGFVLALAFFVTVFGAAPVAADNYQLKIQTAVRMSRQPAVSERSERAIIEESLSRNQGNRQLTARELGMHRSTLWRKIRQYGLES